jgi:hypothetical protein
VGSAPQHSFGTPQNCQVTKEVLEGIGAGKLPSLLILNKIDAVDISQEALLKKEFLEAIAMSALNPKDIEALRSGLVNFFFDNMAHVELVVPYGKEGVLADIRKNIHVLSESYGEKGVCLKINANPGTVTALKRGSRRKNSNEFCVYGVAVRSEGEGNGVAEDSWNAHIGYLEDEVKKIDERADKLEASEHRKYLALVKQK